jgi:peptidoglycan hydrolase-like protein with peptidoglycan-binding domain
MTLPPFGMKAPFGLLVAVALTAGLGACASDDKMAAAPAPAPAPAPMAAPAPVQPAPMMHSGRMSHKQRVEALQTALNANGAQLTVDGRAGAKTTAALKAYQKSHNLRPTGHPDPKTSAALGI